MTISKNTRVQLLQVAEIDIPEGSFGTVVDIFPDDDDLFIVIPDCRPNCRMHYWSNEIGVALKEVE